VPPNRSVGLLPTKGRDLRYNSKGSSSNSRKGGNTGFSCHGVLQTRSSPPGRCQPVSKTRARCSGNHSGVSFLPRPSYKAIIPPGRWLPGSIGTRLVSGTSSRKKSLGRKCSGTVAAHEQIGIPNVIRFETTTAVGWHASSRSQTSTASSGGACACGRRQRLPVETHLPKGIFEPPYPQAVRHIPHLNPWRQLVFHLGYLSPDRP
jgi:hypothetical protein